MHRIASGLKRYGNSSFRIIFQQKTNEDKNVNKEA
jgi:hypothetical protein